MARHIVIMGILLFNFLVIVSSQLNTLVTFKTGKTRGGCDKYLGNLANWYEETNQSVASALAAVALYNDAGPDGALVRKALFEWFRIPQAKYANPNKPKATVQDVINKLNSIADWLDGKYPTTIPMHKTNDNPIVILAVPAYDGKISGGVIPWWAGEYIDVNGYYFTLKKSGGAYCTGGNLGLTATLQLLTIAGEPKSEGMIQTVVICPVAFNSQAPDSYADAVAMTSEGTSLDAVMLKSATLLHEAFHVVFDGLAECADAAKVNVATARKNLENYVYFVAAMHFWQVNDDGISTNWDFVTSGPNDAQKV
ncbi:hypothetical protein NPX13_g7848 [Xylaria arbuscula]|uniref:Lysine-specific metallo-endopeptidase domain-containing protein n=1 Tax=Xylaria arbuscula TaxID=114810 RepID=A0A9W8N9Q1_9PEZI|nr:hypothetical protein NPX13_g7848 [Xylaria arbuscula]